MNCPQVEAYKLEWVGQTPSQPLGMDSVPQIVHSFSPRQNLRYPIPRAGEYGILIYAGGIAANSPVSSAMRFIHLCLVVLLFPLPGSTEEFPIFDAHIHYSHDAWAPYPPEKAISILREAGVTGALLSSSNDEGQQRLYALAPDLIIPELRPYRRRGETRSWVNDETVIGYLQENLNARGYVGIGEFHVDGADADLPVVKRTVELARERGLLLHAHSDSDAVERLFRQWPEARILWAHAGFASASRVGDMLRKYRKLWCDLSFRYEIANGNRIHPEWRALFLEFPDRFMVGTDTYTPGRWEEVADHARWAREWLALLPRSVAEAIAWKNGERVFGSDTNTN